MSAQLQRGSAFTHLYFILNFFYGISFEHILYLCCSYSINRQMLISKSISIKNILLLISRINCIYTGKFLRLSQISSQFKILLYLAGQQYIWRAPFCLYYTVPLYSLLSLKCWNLHVFPACNHLRCNTFAKSHLLNVSSLVHWSRYSRQTKFCFDHYLQHT